MKVNKLFTLALFLLLPLISNSEVLIATRPFAIDPASYFMNIDGLFIINMGEQIIGVHVINTGASTLKNVRGTLTTVPGSGIALTKAAVSIGDLPPGVPVLIFFKGSFEKCAPGKYDLTLDVHCDGFSYKTTRPIFVIRTTVIDTNHGMAEVPEGMIEAEDHSLFGGTNLNSIFAPTSLTMTMVPSSPFGGQYSSLPYSDIWWKVAGFIAFVGAKIYEELAEPLPGSVGDAIATGVETVGGLAALACSSDCFRRGEENTFPAPDEFTTREAVVVNVSYLDEPVFGTPFSAEVDWTFTRYTTGNTYTYKVSEVVTNEHFTTSRTIATDKEIYQVGEDIVITAKILGSNGVPLSNEEILVVTWLDTDGNLASRDDVPERKVFLRDDGRGADKQAGDGMYTGIYTIKANDPLGTWGIFVFVQNVNLAGPEEEPLVMAQKCGGLMISAPSFLGLSIQADAVVKIVRMR